LFFSRLDICHGKVVSWFPHICLDRQNKSDKKQRMKSSLIKIIMKYKKNNLKIISEDAVYVKSSLWHLKRSSHIGINSHLWRQIYEHYDTLLLSTRSKEKEFEMIIKL
jgi:hypothetical protein